MQLRNSAGPDYLGRKQLSHGGVSADTYHKLYLFENLVSRSKRRPGHTFRPSFTSMRASYGSMLTQPHSHLHSAIHAHKSIIIIIIIIDKAGCTGLISDRRRTPDAGVHPYPSCRPCDPAAPRSSGCRWSPSSWTGSLCWPLYPRCSPW